MNIYNKIDVGISLYQTKQETEVYEIKNVHTCLFEHIVSLELKFTFDLKFNLRNHLVVQYKILNLLLPLELK
jgi:hypothetical protein